MKVGKLLRLTSATKIDITIPTTDSDGTGYYYTWCIDYLRKEENFFGSLHSSIDSTYYLPKEVKQLEVESFTACNDTLLIFTKGDK